MKPNRQPAGRLREERVHGDSSDGPTRPSLAAAWSDLEKAQQRLKDVAPPDVPLRDLYRTTSSAAPKVRPRSPSCSAHKSDLILIHNMGSGCPYCTMWADGFNGVIHHLEDRSAFVVVSPDSVETQQQLRQKRGWRFRLYSAQGTSLFKDMGFESEDENYGSHAMPGVSVFHKSADGSIVRVSWDYLGPGDAYCSVWHLFNLLRDGAGDWEPQFEYSS